MWVHVSRLKMLEDMRWVENSSTIMKDDDAYYAHMKVRFVN